jgi:hypothetical protein
MGKIMKEGSVIDGEINEVDLEEMDGMEDWMDFLN